jgi:hypothetical protein
MALAQHRRIAAQPLGSMLWCKQGSTLCVLVLSNAVFDRHLLAPRDLSLPKPVKEMILAAKPPRSWRVSVESLAHRGTGISQGYSA